MPAGAEFLTQQTAMTFLLNGHYGAGKTRQAMTFPKVYAVVFDPSGLDILKQTKLAKLADNLAWYEYCNPMNDVELRDAFRKAPNKEGKRGLIYQYIDHIKELAVKGEVKSVLWDGVTYFVDRKWKLISLDEVETSARTGNTDRQAMYRNLGIWCMDFFQTELLPLSTRYGLNILATCHIKRESDEQIEGTAQKAGKVTKLSEIAPMIEGGFRNKIEGLFGASIYLERKLDTTGKEQYLAHASIKQAFQTIVEGKNRFGLPQSFDITEKGLADEVSKFIKVSNQQPVVANQGGK